MIFKNKTNVDNLNKYQIQSVLQSNLKKKLSPLFCFFNLHYKNIKMIRNSKSLLQLNHDLSEMSSKLQPLFEFIIFPLKRKPAHH